jgi:hypothetical protein
MKKIIYMLTLLPKGVRGLGKLIHEKNLKSKISWHCPFKGRGWWNGVVLKGNADVESRCRGLDFSSNAQTIQPTSYITYKLKPKLPAKSQNIKSLYYTRNTRSPSRREKERRWKEKEEKWGEPREEGKRWVTAEGKMWVPGEGK